MTGSDVLALVVGEGADSFAAPALKAEGWTVTTAGPSEALDWVQRHQPDIVVLHVERFGLGLEVCRAVRAHSRVPIMVLSGSSSEEDAVAGLRCGADALVVEGIGVREFVARLRALLRRVPSQARHAPVDTLVVGPVALNRATRQVLVNDHLLALPRREFDILEMLMRDVDRTVTRANLRRQLWGASKDSRTLDVQVRRLRGRLAAIEGWRRIVTIRGVGYRLTTDFEALEPDVADIEIDLTEARPDATDGRAPVTTRPG